MTVKVIFAFDHCTPRSDRKPTVWETFKPMTPSMNEIILRSVAFNPDCLSALLIVDAQTHWAASRKMTDAKARRIAEDTALSCQRLADEIAMRALRTDRMSFQERVFAFRRSADLQGLSPAEYLEIAGSDNSWSETALGPFDEMGS